MLLREHMSKDLILCNIKAKKKPAVIEEMVECLARARVVTDKEEFSTAINNREGLETTAIGKGIAIPHARSKSVKELRVAFGCSRKGVDFQAVDKKPVHIIFMVASPTRVHKEYSQLIAKIARLLRSRIMQEALLKAKTPGDILELIQDFDRMLIEEIRVKTKKGRVVYKK